VKYGGYGIAKRGNGNIRLLAKWFGVPAINKSGVTTGSSGTVNIAPAVADHVTRCDIYLQYGSGAKKHSGFGLSAIANIAVILTGVKTNFDPIEQRDRFDQPFVDRFCGRAILPAAANVGLIAYHDQKKPSFFEPPAAGHSIVVKVKLLYGCRRTGAAVPQKWPIQHAVTV